MASNMRMVSGGQRLLANSRILESRVCWRQVRTTALHPHHQTTLVSEEQHGAPCSLSTTTPRNCLQNTPFRRAVAVKAAVATEAAEAPAKVTAGSSTVSVACCAWASFGVEFSFGFPQLLKAHMQLPQQHL